MKKIREISQVVVCLTVLNEDKRISSLLDSLLKQGVKPDKIVIVDGGSTDKTVEILRHYAKKDKRIKFTVEPGNIAHGRNTAIEVSDSDIVVSTDAGCIPHKDWLEKITAPFKHKNVDMVAGFYHMSAKTPLQKAMNVFLGVPPERYDPTSFLPSARSVAFRKKLWEKIGGFSEKLEYAGEDTLFFYEAVKNKAKIVRVGEAIVDWVELEDFTLKDSLKKFFVYAKGDAQSGIWWHPTKQTASHNLKISAIFARYLLGLILLIYSFGNTFALNLLIGLFVLYVFWSIAKWRDVLTKWEERVWLPVVQITSDIAVMGGFLSGLFHKKTVEKNLKTP